MKLPTEKFTAYWLCAKGESSNIQNTFCSPNLLRVLVAAADNNADIQHMSRFWKEQRLAPEQSHQYSGGISWTILLSITSCRCNVASKPSRQYELNFILKMCQIWNKFTTQNCIYQNIKIRTSLKFFAIIQFGISSYLDGYTKIWNHEKQQLFMLFCNIVEMCRSKSWNIWYKWEEETGNWGRKRMGRFIMLIAIQILLRWPNQRR